MNYGLIQSNIFGITNGVKLFSVNYRLRRKTLTKLRFLDLTFEFIGEDF